MEVVVLNRQRAQPVRGADLAAFLRRLAAELPVPEPAELALCLVSDRRMRELNRTYRGRDTATDVLSFRGERRRDPSGQRHLGDILIAVPTAARQARDRGHAFARELERLALHGYLHLLGYDHETDDGAMRRLERSLGRRRSRERAGGAHERSLEREPARGGARRRRGPAAARPGSDGADGRRGGALALALRALSQEHPRLAFLEQMQRPPSPYRSAVTMLRQLSLLGATLLLVISTRAVGWPYPLVGGAALGAVLGVLLLEALAARSLALWNPRVALRSTAFLIRAAYALLCPLVLPLQLVLLRVGRSQQHGAEERDGEQEQEVEALIEVGEREGLLEASEGEMMRGIVDLDETLTREIMTPRTDIVALAEDTPVGQARAAFLEGGHSRLPVFRGSIDHVVVMLHSRDLLRAWEAGDERATTARYLRPAVFVPETLTAAELLVELRQKSQIAIVVDEYGGTAGLVTLEDLLEEIVGEIHDEHQQAEELIHTDADCSWVINGVAHVEELESLFDIEFAERDFDTVAGSSSRASGACPIPARPWRSRACASRSCRPIRAACTASGCSGSTRPARRARAHERRAARAEPRNALRLVALTGWTNVGKSTLLNRLVGAKLAAVADVAQTTRWRIEGVRSLAGHGQIVFVDTPGLHRPRHRMNRGMVEVTRRALHGVDLPCSSSTRRAGSARATHRPPPSCARAAALRSWR